jgi:hypothetical protein
MEHSVGPDYWPGDAHNFANLGDNAENKNSSRHTSTKEAMAIGHERILVVEDEELVALAIKKCLEKLGYEVPEIVASGEEAVRKSAALQVDSVPSARLSIGKVLRRGRVLLGQAQRDPTLTAHYKPY